MKWFKSAITFFLILVSVSAYGATSTITKGLIGSQDMHMPDGTATRTFTRSASTGDTLTLNDVGYEVDALITYGAGSVYTDTTIQSALTAIGTTNKVTLLLRPGTWVISDDLTVTSNITLRGPPGALLQIATTKTLTINGPLEAGLHQLFNCVGTGKVVFGKAQPGGVQAVWFGVVADGATDDATAYSKAITAANSLSAVMAPSGTSIISEIELTAATQVYLRGQGVKASTLKHKAAATATMIHQVTTALSVFEMSGFTLDGNQANITDWDLGIVDVKADYLDIRNNEVINAKHFGLRTRGVTYHGKIINNWIHDMAQHGGTTGQDITAILIGQEATVTSTIDIFNNTIEYTSAPATAGASAGGIVVNPDTGKNQTVNIAFNTLRYMGCSRYSNAIAPITIYKNGDYSTISYNKIYDSYGGGIKVQRSSWVTVDGNTLSGDGDVYTTLTDNYAIQFTGRATVTPMYGNIVKNNKIYNMPKHKGIHIAGDSTGEFYDLSITGNFIDTAQSGIYVSYPLSSVQINNNNVKTIVGAATADKSIMLANLSNAVYTSVEINENILNDTDKAACAVDPGSAWLGDINFHRNTIGTAADQNVYFSYAQSVFTSHNKFRDAAPTIKFEQCGYVEFTDNYAVSAPTITNTSNTVILIRDNSWEHETVTAGSPTLTTGGISKLNSAGGAITATMPDGLFIGQKKTIVMTNATASSTVSITHHETSDPEVGTFDAVGETWEGIWQGVKWLTVKATCTFL